MMRRYGSIYKTPEDLRLCAAKVPEGGRSPLFRQCGNRRGHGPGGILCARHAAMDPNHVDIPEDKTEGASA